MQFAVLIGFVLAASSPLLNLWCRERTSLVLALFPALMAAWLIGQAPVVLSEGPQLLEWAWVPSLGISLSFLLDGLSLLFGLLISVIGTCVLIYAGGYLKGHPDIARFHLALVAFMVVGWLVRRFKGAPAGGPQLAGAGAPYAPQVPTPHGAVERTAEPLSPQVPPSASMAAQGGAVPQAGSAAALPPGVDAAGFIRLFGLASRVRALKDLEAAGDAKAATAGNIKNASAPKPGSLTGV